MRLLALTFLALTLTTHAQEKKKKLGVATIQTHSKTYYMYLDKNKLWNDQTKDTLQFKSFDAMSIYLKMKVLEENDKANKTSKNENDRNK